MEQENNMDKEMNRPFNVNVTFTDHMRDLGEAVINSRAIHSFDNAAACYPILRLARCVARRPMERVSTTWR